MKSLILSAALLATSAAASDAATFTYNMTLRYEGLLFENARIHREVLESANTVKVEVLHEGNLWADQDIWGLKSSLPRGVTGTTINFWASVDIPDEFVDAAPGTWPYPSPASISSCYMGWISCNGGAVSSLDPLNAMWWDNTFLRIGSGVGETVSYHYYQGARGVFDSYYKPDEMAYYYTQYDGVEARFTILDVTSYAELAPVPLPASAALLIAGIGGLAVLRRRKS